MPCYENIEENSWILSTDHPYHISSL